MNTHSFSAINSRTRVGSDGSVIGAFRAYSLASTFQPIYSLSHRHPVGYEALCRARSDDGSAVSPVTLFGQSYGESEDVLLDRLCRAVHIQNFAACADKKSWIFLNVNPLVTVVGKNYGSFFREMLAHNQIPPSQVVIEILEQHFHDESVLTAAVNYYKELGCLVAIDDFGACHSNFDRVWNIQPDIVKLDRSIIVQAESSQMVRRALPNLVSLIQELGCIALMEGVETEQQALIALNSNVDLVQGYYFGCPARQLVEPSDQSNMLSQLCSKHSDFSAAVRSSYREAVDPCMHEFKILLQTIKAGAEKNASSCANLLSIPKVMRIYFMDESGNQISENITNKNIPEHEDPRYTPLSEASDANWSRRNYFSQAMLSPDEIQITRPYRSLARKTQCITLCAMIDTVSGKLVACLDMDWS